MPLKKENETIPVAELRKTAGPEVSDAITQWGICYCKTGKGKG